MWKYIQGARPPPAKISKLISSEEKKNQAKIYEHEKRKRKFIEAWRSGRDWLSFDQENNVMSCTWCKSYSLRDVDKKSNFVVGCTNFKLDAVVSHETCELHRRSAGVWHAQQTVTSESTAAKALQSLNKSIFDRLCCDWRARLRPSVLSDILFVMFHAPDIQDFDPTDAINFWYQSGVRSKRPNTLPYGPQVKNDTDDDTDYLDIWTELDPDYIDKK